MNKKVYQIYFEPQQRGMLSPYTIPYYNEKLSPFFENDVIKDLYEKGEVHSSDYFGVLSWRIESKNYLSLSLLNNITFDHNLYSFRKTVVNHNVFQVSNICHPKFGYLFDKMLTNLGLSYNDFVRVEWGLYQNAIIAHRDIYLDYLENWLLPSMKFIETNTDPMFVSYLKSDPLYSLYPPGRREKLQEFLGTPWYQYHTFICERLWSIYFHVNGAKIKHCFL
jgi:hypothetical protein